MIYYKNKLQQQRKHITVFEHESLRIDRGEKRISEIQLKSLQAYFGESGVPYFSLIHNGIRFNEFVGVIQLGELVIEVLPKADASFAGDNDKKQWRDILIDMLFAVGVFDIHTPSNSSLKLKSNSILDLYFKIFIQEIESLLHRGLIKKYRKKNGNVIALKGSLHFSKHIQQNLTHQERFFVKHTTYDVEHQLHFIIYKTICLLRQINTNVNLHSRIGALMLHFPEMPDIKVTEATFEKIVFSRKTESYKKAIEISKLLLLQYHPDVSRGRNNVLALMFDMNKLWEQFVYVSLRKHKNENTKITGQTSKLFWKSHSGYRVKMRPDIVVNKDGPDCVVLDTKWKNLNGYNPSPDDLRQMYVYHEYYGANKVALIYPGKETSNTNGNYIDPMTRLETKKECSVISFIVEPKIKHWQKKIYTELESWWSLQKQNTLKK
ncbi:restriction endonuclease [Flavobacterium branchiophilum]|uniref:5-methylcytosine-specific restriction enzyme subunit McrC n=1 Tax=Flavobacterium branchiophilum TaxID=55197 RepID=A0A543G169_9FLAO|nr:restriction endonuclease [Flavobacterium branchiophilum]OXA67331.1 restriction endonuclease [Flavobacterium branchiophilum] [Flavobacterium branchiophilum NBRC 15030 = ATCC 35035]TQM39830.1 5-methylcytosine-specific restriction enzyme subunit McrC [Flavobacterium branchiophilum]GEM56645.1 IQ calmodulin-binding- domain protein [Flavobacterium branchiophilum NBRC 15030 = ATCC 35035]